MFFFSCFKKLIFFFHIQNIFILLYSTNKISMPSIIFFLLVRCAHSPSVPSPSSLLSICKQLLKFAGPFFFTSQEMTSPFPWRYRICCRRSQTNHRQSYIDKNKKKRHRSKIIVLWRSRLSQHDTLYMEFWLGDYYEEQEKRVKSSCK